MQEAQEENEVHLEVRRVGVFPRFRDHQVGFESAEGYESGLPPGLTRHNRRDCFDDNPGHREGQIVTSGYQHRDTEGQTEQMWCLTLVTNAIVTWSTEYYGRATAALARRGHPVDDSLLAHVWPSHYENVNFYGSHTIDIDGVLAQLGAPLRKVCVCQEPTCSPCSTFLDVEQRVVG